MSAPTLFDAHIHLGQFYNQYTSPLELRTFLDSVKVDYFAASSTTTCDCNYAKIIDEITELKKLCGDRLFPILWVLPQMLKDGGLDLFLNSGIHWCCLKIHPQLHPTAWLDESQELQKVASLAGAMQVPLLIHTGEMEGCYPSLYEKAFRDYPNVVFILAHGRPIEETIEMMKKYSNVWTDTAFMPTENIVKLCEKQLTNRVLWGTDYPVPIYYYPDMDMKEYYNNLVKQLNDSVSYCDFEKITNTNFKKLFG